MKLLIVEDEDEMGRLLARGLTAEGYEVDRVANGIDALISAAATSYSAAIVDVMLPGMSGFEFCRRMRAQNGSVPLLLLTARDAVDDRVRGLDAGADDYLTKPFAFAELTARIRALLRRESAAPQLSVSVGSLVIDSHNRRATVGGKSISLSPKEFDLLRLLAEKPGTILSRAEILDEVWGRTENIDANVVDQYISYLRRKIDPCRPTSPSPPGGESGTGSRSLSETSPAVLDQGQAHARRPHHRRGVLRGHGVRHAPSGGVDPQQLVDHAARERRVALRTGHRRR